MIAAFDKIEAAALHCQHRHKVHTWTIQHVRDLLSGEAWKKGLQRDDDGPPRRQSVRRSFLWFTDRELLKRRKQLLLDLETKTSILWQQNIANDELRQEKV